MLLLDFDLDGEPLVQGFVRAQWPGPEASADRVAKWAALFRRSAALWNQFGMRSAALRLEARPRAPLTSVHAFVAPQAQQARLRLALAAMLRTHDFAGATAETLRDPAELEGAYTHLGDARVELGYEPLTTGGGVRLRYNLRLFDHLDEIVMAASDLGVAFAYEAQIAPWVPPRDLLRGALYDLAELGRRATPDELLRDQQALAERLKRAAYYVEECLACPSAQAAAEIANILDNLLADTLYGRFGVAPRAGPLSLSRAEAFGRHVHSWLTVGDQGGDASAAGATKDDIDARLTLRKLLGAGKRAAFPEAGAGGGPGGGPLFAALTDPVGPRGPAPRGPAAAAAAPFLFVSYARNDANEVYPLVATLSQQNVSTWIDRSIPGGDDWPTAIEERLLECSGVLALISPSFVNSHYCPREVIFADALRKPILPIFIRPAKLERGLAWLLSSHNQIAANDIALIVAAIRRHAASTLH